MPERLRAALLSFLSWCEARRRRLGHSWSCDHEEAALLVEVDIERAYGKPGFPRDVETWAPGVFAKKVAKVRHRRSRSLSLSDENRWIRKPWAARGLGASGWVDLLDRRSEIECFLSPQQKRVLAAFLDKHCHTEAEIAKELDMRICSVSNQLERIGHKIRKICQLKNT